MQWLKMVWEKVKAFFWRATEFLRDASDKFSHKRLIAVAFAVVSIFLLFQREWWGAGIAGVVVLVLAAISAITAT